MSFNRVCRHKQPPVLSYNLRRLLADDTITKVFCDNFSHGDKKSLGVYYVPDATTATGSATANATDDDNQQQQQQRQRRKPFSEGPVVDLEVLAAELLGETKVPRGLSKILTLLDVPPGLSKDNVLRIGKPSGKAKRGNGRLKDVGRYALIEQGKAKPLYGGIAELSEEERRYAALDSWCTLQAYKRLLQLRSELRQQEHQQQQQQQEEQSVPA